MCSEAAIQSRPCVSPSESCPGRRPTSACTVVLRVDAGRSVADVWEVLRIGKAAGVEHFSLAVKLPERRAPAAAALPRPREELPL